MRIVVALAFLATLAAAESAAAQEWPQRPVRIIVPYAAGGLSDEIGRLITQPLGEAFRQPFVLENRSGASGAIAAEAVARSAPDGYTLFLASLPQIAIMPAAMKTSFDPKDVVPISAIVGSPLVLVAHPGVPATSVAELVAYARTQQGQLTYAAAGVGTISHLTMTLFLKRAGIEMTPVMYKGGAPAVADVIAGHVKAHFAVPINVMPYASGDMLRFLAVTSGQRMAQIPTVPTMIESGYPGFKMLNWTGLMAPAGTPRDIIDRLAHELSRIVRDPKIAAIFAASGVDPLGGGPEEFAAMIAADIPVWADAVKTAGIRQN
ncbi:MAG TPA: tripartite tricarboxylate transporter substrate binding protein [Xanthobacteraceae bacterium]|nr:tripartite tricarboxylate transporter substrate binding protein [Xanthobacteraceae bacterium]